MATYKKRGYKPKTKEEVIVETEEQLNNCRGF